MGDQARKAAETAARKAEAKKLADEEAEALAVSAKKAPAANKKAPVSVAKVGRSLAPCFMLFVTVCHACSLRNG